MFKIGMIVKGNEKSSLYTITRPGCKLRVTNIIGKRYFSGIRIGCRDSSEYNKLLQTYFDSITFSDYAKLF